MPVSPSSAHPHERLADVVRDGFPAAIADLSALVRIPSVSWDGFDPAHVQGSADAVADLLRGLGLFDDVGVVRAELTDGSGPGQPAVLARRAARDGRPTVLLYAHHDVQPPGREEDWDSPPYEPTLRGDRLYGRGTSDDKAGVIVHVAALRAIVEVLDPEIGIAVFIEGEEEFGSGSFRNLLADHRDALAADAIIVADSGNWDVETPAITVGLRGMVAIYLTIESLEHASHSGMYGGAVPDAPLVAAKLLATLWDDEGAVAVGGLRSHVAPVPDYPEERLRGEAGLPDGVRTIGRGELLSRIWNQPSITLTGMDIAAVQHASNTLTPRVSLRLSVRVAPGQSTAEALAAVQAHLEANNRFGARISYDKIESGEPFLVDTSAPYFGEAKRALAEAWGAEPVEMGVGGSIPFIAELVEAFPSAQILITGVEDPDTRAHSPNESLHLGVLRRAILAEALFLAALNEGE